MEKSIFYFVVSGKIIKKANKRNIFKRRGSHIIRSCNVKNGYTGVFFAKKGIHALEYVNFKQEILDLLKKSSILAKK